MSILGLPLRLWCLKHLIGFSARRFMSEVFMKIILISVIATVLPLLLHLFMVENVLTVAIDFAVAFVSAGFSIYFLGLSVSERVQVRKIYKKIISKFNRAYGII